MDLQGSPLELFVRNYVTQGAGFVVLLTLIFLVVWKWGARRFAGSRIHTRRHADAKQIRSELKHTLVTLAIGAANATVVVVLYREGVTRLSADVSGWSPLALLGCVVGLVLFNDVWFYGWHRLLHHPKLFKYVHAVHHQSVDVNPFTSYSFHAVEAFLLGAWAVPMVMLVPLPIPIFGVVQLIGTGNNVMSHLGYEFLPRWFIKVPPFKWLNSATFHSLHHTQFNGNYGLFTRFWDRLFGTEVPGYEQAFVERGSASEKPGVTVLANE
jgi:sterol desaturase/sphingolipid hydroxylase (fatty acid hydroxylase superfamily)